MVRAAIDHLVVTAPSLVSGAAYIQRELGVAMQPGGEHPLMGTHNVLLKLDDATYLEVLAINPAAPRPDCPRWFELDRVTTPALAAWVARVDDIHAAVASSSLAFGAIERMGRGALTWLITIPQDGRLPGEGVAPLLIQWLNGPHPASTLRDSGCSLSSLSGTHPRADLLAGLELDARWSLSTTGLQGLEAFFQTPAGMRTLRTRSHP
jgi:hypothetical protein